MKRTRGFLPTVLFSAVLLAGCGGAEVDSAEDPSVPDGVAAPSDARLIEAGEEPRHELRFRPEVGLTQSSTLVMTMTSATSLGEDGFELEMRTEVEQVSEVTDVADNGEFSVTHTFTSFDLVAAEETLDGMGDAFEMLEGMQLTTTVSPTGEVLRSDAEFPETDDPMFDQMIGQVTDQLADNVAIALPVEPVGVGAVWEVTIEQEVLGSTLAGHHRYTVVEVDDESVTLAVTTDLDLGALAGEGGSFEAESSGTVVLSLDRPMPLRSEMTQTQEMTVVDEAGGESVEMRIRTAIDLELTSR
jgi:hypothetical protein